MGQPYVFTNIFEILAESRKLTDNEEEHRTITLIENIAIAFNNLEKSQSTYPSKVCWMSCPNSPYNDDYDEDSWDGSWDDSYDDIILHSYPEIEDYRKLELPTTCHKSVFVEL